MIRRYWSNLTPGTRASITGALFLVFVVPGGIVLLAGVGFWKLFKRSTTSAQTR